MTEEVIIRDKNGNVINIGEWDFMQTVELDPNTGEEFIVINNPMPDDAYEDKATIVTLPDGGLTVDE